MDAARTTPEHGGVGAPPPISHTRMTMSAHSTIESWISQTAFAVGGVNGPDADGFWKLPYGRITLSLGVMQNDCFLLYAPLMSVAGAGDATLAAFYPYLLQLQLQGALPIGMTFAMEEGDTLVGMAGHYPLKKIDFPNFDKLLGKVASAADELCGLLQSRFCELLDGEAPATTPEQGPQSAPTPAMNASQLSDEELLARMMQGVLF